MTENIEKTFSVASPAFLCVYNLRGSVEIHPGEDGIIQVTGIKQLHTGDEKRTEIEIDQEEDGTVKVATRFPDSSWNWLIGSQPCEVDYVVKAPRKCSLKLNGVSNTILAEGFEGATTVNSISGAITLDDLTGSVNIHNVSGEVYGKRITGAMGLDTVSGDVTLQESDLSSIKANTISGDLRMSTGLSAGPYDFKSVSGQVHLMVPPDTHCAVELHSVSGDLVSAFPVAGYSYHLGSQAVEVQGGGAKISLQSVSGDLSLDCDGDIPPAPKPSRTISSEERRAVLESIDRGELSVEQALGQLHA
jgi:hypothetical protein